MNHRKTNFDNDQTTAYINPPKSKEANSQPVPTRKKEVSTGSRRRARLTNFELGCIALATVFAAVFGGPIRHSIYNFADGAKTRIQSELAYFSESSEETNIRRQNFSSPRHTTPSSTRAARPKIRVGSTRCSNSATHCSERSAPVRYLIVRTNLRQTHQASCGSRKSNCGN